MKQACSHFSSPNKSSPHLNIFFCIPLIHYGTWSFCVLVNVGEDCPVFDGLYEFCQLSAGGSVAAAVKLNKQASEICINWGGGWYSFEKTYEKLVSLHV